MVSWVGSLMRTRGTLSSGYLVRWSLKCSIHGAQFNSFDLVILNSVYIENIKIKLMLYIFLSQWVPNAHRETTKHTYIYRYLRRYRSQCEKVPCHRCGQGFSKYTWRPTLKVWTVTVSKGQINILELGYMPQRGFGVRLKKNKKVMS